MGHFFLCVILFVLMITVEYEGKRIANAIETAAMLTRHCAQQSSP